MSLPFLEILISRIYTPLFYSTSKRQFSHFNLFNITTATTIIQFYFDLVRFITLFSFSFSHFHSNFISCLYTSLKFFFLLLLLLLLFTPFNFFTCLFTCLFVYDWMVIRWYHYYKYIINNKLQVIIIIITHQPNTKTFFFFFYIIIEI